MALLEVKGLEVYYGVIQALKGISFEVGNGEIVTLIGANGAGKTTTMQSIMGLIPARSGVLLYDGQEITKMPCHKIVHKGIVQVPEGRRIFQELTVYEKNTAGYGGNLPSVPSIGGTAPAGGGNTVRWRTANAGYGPRHDEPSQTFNAG